MTPGIASPFRALKGTAGMPRSECPSEAELTAFHLGDLPEGVLDDIAGHLESCPHCEARARALDELTDPTLAPFRRSAQGHAAAGPAPERVGDYDILGELGRGGSGRPAARADRLPPSTNSSAKYGTSGLSRPDCHSPTSKICTM